MQTYLLYEVKMVFPGILTSTDDVDSIIDAHLSSMNYDARKLPLGMLDCRYYF